MYPPETFGARKQYGLSVMVTSDPALGAYLEDVLRQMTGARAGALSVLEGAGRGRRRGEGGGRAAVVVGGRSSAAAQRALSSLSCCLLPGTWLTV